jgi:chromosomal replication initiator protein
MELTASELWSRILRLVQAGISEQSFRTWFTQTSPSSLSEGELVVEAPSDFHVEWIEDKYGGALAEAAQRILGRPLDISVVSSETAAVPPVPTVELTRSDPGSSDPVTGAGSLRPAGGGGAFPGPGLNHRYTFLRFVVGDDNQLASAASRAVAEKPARMYNPLFLYGGVGLGKTHLMHAIGNAIVENDPGRKVAYVPSEHFTNDLVTAIQEGTTGDFRRRYRRIDLLLVDDIHFLEGKERTQEEFFHTFNALYDAQKQIVVTSDRPPKEIPGLEQRLVSRFEWGLVADIQAPDFETRVAILRKKALDDGLTLDDEVIDFIARSCTSSVRELEGAVIKLLAYSSLKHREIDLSLARKALQGMFGGDRASTRGRPTVDGVRDAVARHWDVKPAALASKRRTKDLTVPRQVAMYLIRELLELPLTRIGDTFGGRDHSTVIHSIRKVEERMARDAAFERAVQGLRNDLERDRGP